MEQGRRIYAAANIALDDSTWLRDSNELPTKSGASLTEKEIRWILEFPDSVKFLGNSYCATAQNC